MKLSEITSPAALKNLSDQELQSLSEELRDAIIRTVAVNGGHLASNLGVVELVIALHRVLECPKDKLIFDVGHQCYAHKMLTGRYERFSTIRKMDGLCGFPRREESEFDAYDTGHASTAISAALGMARARDLKKGDYRVVAVVGDGAMTGGLCYEALNDAGSTKTPMLVVLNDNGMSISRNVGALSQQLTKLRVSRGWLGTKKNISDALLKLPLGGKKLHHLFQKMKNNLRNALVKDRFFTSLGFRYFGPIDGHDIAGMEKVFSQLIHLDEPVLVHVVTKKGQGFKLAEERPEKYHGVSPFLMDNGQTREQAAPSMGSLAGKHVTALAETNDKLCVITAAMTDSAGFGPFAARYPDRLFDVGIAEEHALTMAAGMAAAGARPVVAIYETFMQRGFDQIAEDICLQQLPVCLLMDRAGLGGEDGATHHGILGVSMLLSIPGIRILAPRNEDELIAMIDFALTHEGPTAIRYPRSAPAVNLEGKSFAPGKWESLREGKDAAILASSAILKECLDAAELLDKKGIHASVINASSIRPLDESMLRGLFAAHIPVITVEEHVLSGAFGYAVAAWCAQNRLACPAAMIGLPDAFIPHGSRKGLLEKYRLDGSGIARQVEEAVKK